MFYWIFIVTFTYIVISLLIYTTFLWSNVYFQLHEICFISVVGSFIPVILITFKFTSQVLFKENVLLDRSSGVLQPPLHLSRLTINGYWCSPQLYSTGFKSMKVGLVMHVWLFKNIHFAGNDPLKLSNNKNLNNKFKDFIKYEY